MSYDDEIDQALWNRSVDSEKYSDTPYQNHLLEQYKIYVEMADRISQRRGSANTFFLAINTALIGALAAMFDKIPMPVAPIFFLGAAIFCVAWFLLLRSYRNLNSAKFEVIGHIEKRLPCSPYWSAEWRALGEGKDWRKYIPLSLVETLMPIVFYLLYLAMIAVAINRL